MHYIGWLALSAVFHASGEYLSKRFALRPSFLLAASVILTYAVGSILWLPAIAQKNQLSTVGTMAGVICMTTTVLIGVLWFEEKLNLAGIVGVVLAFAAVILLSVGVQE